MKISCFNPLRPGPFFLLTLFPEGAGAAGKLFAPHWSSIKYLPRRVRGMYFSPEFLLLREFRLFLSLSLLLLVLPLSRSGRDLIDDLISSGDRRASRSPRSKMRLTPLVIAGDAADRRRSRGTVDARDAPKKMTRRFNRAAFHLSSLSIGNFRLGRRCPEGRERGIIARHCLAAALCLAA